MKKDDDLRPEYDLRSLRVRRLGPQRRKFGTIIKLDPDVAALFPTAEDVNQALRALAKAQQ